MTRPASPTPVREPALADTAIRGIADLRALPDAGFASQWASVILPDGMKERLVRNLVAGIRLRSAVPFPELPLHGVLLLAPEFAHDEWSV